MYCPRCSMKLYKEGDRYICTSKKLDYSVNLSNKIDLLFVEKVDKVTLEDKSGKFFCPQCADTLKNLHCECCNITIEPIFYELIEIHVHGF